MASERAVHEFKRVGDWLAANVPDSYNHAIVHGDYKLDNVMLGRERRPI